MLADSSRWKLYWSGNGTLQDIVALAAPNNMERINPGTRRAAQPLAPLLTSQLLVELAADEGQLDTGRKDGSDGVQRRRIALT